MDAKVCVWFIVVRAGKFYDWIVCLEYVRLGISIYWDIL